MTTNVSNNFSQYTVVPKNETTNSNAKTSLNGALSQAQFLKLMTTQMTHQDPSKPMENGEFLTQMAQFGTVSGIQDLQKSFSTFATNIASGQALQAAGLVGKSVMVSASQGALEAGKSLTGNVVLTDNTANLTVNIIDSKTGTLIRTLSLGAQDKGNIAFSWGGLNAEGQQAAPGVYKIEASALVNGKPVALETQVQAKVNSVQLNNGSNGIMLNLAGGLDSVNFTTVKQIL